MSSASSSTLETVILSVFEPGVPMVIFKIIDWSLILLMTLLVLLLSVGGWSKTSMAIHLYVFFALALGLWISTKLYASLLKQSKDESPKIKKDESPKIKNK
eukprot:TRINITY_DN1131_c0_g1_i1.p1 TRINITY_DN1131_c0_g1~~TRINITY_DN1131_c0_g1_i1.p1  ORF type:complete len:101 (-),score=12.11 TRINITY_DN1131_c0_g1_i1:125-427(-)